MARGKTIKMGSLEDERREAEVHDLPERGRVDVLFDQKLFQTMVRRERASAYWFAATLWGVSGLIIGGLVGVFLTLQVSTASLPVAMEALSRGMAVEAGRRNAEDNPPIITDPAANPPAPSTP